MDNRFMVRRVSNSAVPTMENVPETGEFKVNVNPSGYVNFGYSTDVSQGSLPVPGEDRKKSFIHHTIEALPRVDNYRNGIEAMKRPSMGELHGEEKDLKYNENVAEAQDDQSGHGIKLGWIQGVLIPCLLNIWGVMLFLRLAWVVGQAGISMSLLIILISAIVCILTTTSLSAISTNGEVKGGGIYYIISRSLGPEFGASVGIVFAFANAVAASMNTIGFGNSLNDLLRESGVKIIDNGINDVRIVGVVAILIMTFICAVGMEWESKAQNVLVVIIVAAIIDFIAGCIVGPYDDEQRSKGFVGLNMTTLSDNWEPDFRFSEGLSQNFFSVFAIFFPSVTGIQAGANISGDLKDPAGAIPKGTLLALLISMVSYAVFILFAGASADRDASGNMGQFLNGTYTNCASNYSCEYGLANSYTVMQMMSLWGPLIYAGCFAATLSTALTNLLSVPRLVQALGIDRIYPGLIFFSKGYGKNKEPYRGYVLCFFISVAFLLIAELNAIAPLISNFYLASYALINFCTFHASLIKPLGWRPTYKYYNMWCSLVGFFLCVAIMFLIDWVTSLITFFVIFALYLIVVYRKPDVNWGSSTQAQTYKTALSSTLSLANVSEHVKNYHPQILVLCGKPSARPTLLDLANLITKNNSLLICGDILPKKQSYKSRQYRLRTGYSWLKDCKIKGFYTVVDNSDLEEGSKSMIQAAGVGKLTPNVLMMGYKNNWNTCPSQQLTSYFNSLHEAFHNRVSVVILRIEGGLDYSVDEDESSTPNQQDTNNISVTSANHHTAIGFAFSESKTVISNSSLDFLPPESPQPGRKYNLTDKSTSPRDILKQKKKNDHTDQLKKLALTREGLPQEVISRLTHFTRKQEKGTIDVWWLYDDGGFTILLPYIISTRSNWSHCRLRIFALANRKQELELEERNMASLLSKFRINYQSLKMVEDVTSKPKRETQTFFEDIVRPFTEDSKELDQDCRVTTEELEALQEKTNRHLRLRELLLENSKSASLVVMSLPMPRKGMVSAPLYMAWLEAVSKNMPPMMLVRGNQSSVLTFYS